MSADRGSAAAPALMSASVLSRPDRGPDRVQELELRLRRIGAEVRAAGIDYEEDPDTDLHELPRFPEVAELTTRQLEILQSLLDGHRVSTIASALYISRSTVRNHLTAIFRKFGVHSQAELIEFLRRARG